MQAKVSLSSYHLIHFPGGSPGQHPGVGRIEYSGQSSGDDNAQQAKLQGEEGYQRQL